MAYNTSVDSGSGLSYSKLQIIGDKNNGIFKPIEVRFSDGSIFYTSYATFNGNIQNGIYTTVDKAMSKWREAKNPNPDYWNDKEEVVLFLDGLQVKIDGIGRYYASKEYGLFCVCFK